MRTAAYLRMIPIRKDPESLSNYNKTHTHQKRGKIPSQKGHSSKKQRRRFLQKCEIIKRCTSSGKVRLHDNESRYNVRTIRRRIVRYPQTRSTRKNNNFNNIYSGDISGKERYRVCASDRSYRCIRCYDGNFPETYIKKYEAAFVYNYVHGGD